MIQKSCLFQDHMQKGTKSFISNPLQVNSVGLIIMQLCAIKSIPICGNLYYFYTLPLHQKLVLWEAYKCG